MERVQMMISSRNILARLYRFNFTLSEQHPPIDTNLCHFMRVILLWLPLKLIGFICLAALFSTVIIILPVTNLGFYFYSTLVLLAIAIAYLVVRLIQHEYDSKYDFTKSESLMIVCEYVKAIKRRVCPLVEIKDD